MNYIDTFIAIAEDCPSAEGQEPPAGNKPTIASLTYAMLTEAPYVHTQEDVLFDVHAARKGFEDVSEEERTTLREEFLSKDLACLRAGPLSKRYGWGVHFDSKGRAALVSAGTEDYARLLVEAGNQTKAMRNKRASRA